VDAWLDGEVGLVCVSLVLEEQQYVHMDMDCSMWYVEMCLNECLSSDLSLRFHLFDLDVCVFGPSMCPSQLEVKCIYRRRLKDIQGWPQCHRLRRRDGRGRALWPGWAKVYC
jgi:hypothetical protein